MGNNIIIYSSDFRPLFGGVADFTYNFALQLHNQGLLRCMVTPLAQSNRYVFPVNRSAILYERKLFSRTGDGFALVRMLNTLVYYLIIDVQAFKEAFSEKKCIPIITACFDYETLRLLNWYGILRVRYFILLHGKDILYNMDMNPGLFTKVCKKASGLLFNSLATRELFIKKTGLTASNYRIVYPGIALDYIKSVKLMNREKLGDFLKIPLHNRPLISSLCTLVKRKGIDTALEIISEVIKKRKDILYIVMGDGPDADRLLELSTRLNISDNILFTKRVNDEVKYSVLNESSVFLMPNRTEEGRDFEGFGISFLEAALFENLIIGGNNGGVPEAVLNRETGYLLNFDNHGEILLARDIICNFLDDHEKFKPVIQAGKARAINKFSWSKIAQEFSESFL